MNHQDWSYLRHHQLLNVSLLHAFHRVHIYPRHSHDYYVIGLVECGLQTFTCGHQRYTTPPNGLLFLNPGDVHSGAPADQNGFAYRAIYPTVAHMKAAVFELTGRYQPAPLFVMPRADNKVLAQSFCRLHASLIDNASSLESDSRFLWVLVELIKAFANNGVIAATPARRERQSVQKAQHYIQENYDTNISLIQLANHVNLSRYHFLRTFRDEVGMPPHTYLDSVRIQRAQSLIAEGQSLAQVAYMVGYSNQSHLTRRFKQIIGVTPGKYAHELRS